MPITVNSLTTSNSVDRDCHAIAVWSANITSADVSGGGDIKAAPGVGYQLALTRLTIYIGAAITVTLLDAAAILIGPLGGAAGSSQLDFSDFPLLLPENKSLTVDSSAAGLVSVYADGYVRTL